MLSENQQEDLRKAVLNQLAQQEGWHHANVFGLEFAVKSFDTAVGPKEANVILRPSSEGGWWLSGHYTSEGRNVLSTCDVHIASSTEIASAVAFFAGEVDKAVHESYAASLWLKRQRREC